MGYGILMLGSAGVIVGRMDGIVSVRHGFEGWLDDRLLELSL